MSIMRLNVGLCLSASILERRVRHMRHAVGVVVLMQDDQIGADFPLCEADFNGADAKDNMVRSVS